MDRSPSARVAGREIVGNFPASREFSRLLRKLQFEHSDGHDSVNRTPGG